MKITDKAELDKLATERYGYWMDLAQSLERQLSEALSQQAKDRDKITELRAEVEAYKEDLRHEMAGTAKLTKENERMRRALEEIVELEQGPLKNCLTQAGYLAKSALEGEVGG